MAQEGRAVPCVVREVPCPLVKREGPSEMEPYVAREVPCPLKEQRAAVPISEVRGSERMRTRDVWRRGVGTHRGSEWLSWGEVVERQTSDHQPLIFDVPGTDASVITWNIMRKCRTAPRSNHGSRPVKAHGVTSRVVTSHHSTTLGAPRRHASWHHRS